MKKRKICRNCGKALKDGQMVVLLADGLCHPECKDLKHVCDVCGESAKKSFRGIAGHIFHYCGEGCLDHLRIADDVTDNGRRATIKEARRTFWGDDDE